MSQPWCVPPDGLDRYGVKACLFGQPGMVLGQISKTKPEENSAEYSAHVSSLKLHLGQGQGT